MQHDIFVSWASADELIAETIVEALRHQGLSCWFSDDSVPPGKDWDEQISLAIEGCRLMLVILSEKSIRSRYVKKEIILALDDGLTIVPLRVADVKLPHEIRLTLAGIQHVDVFPDVRKHLDKLAKDLRLLLAKIESSSPEVTLIAPKAGDAWPAGSQQTIRWKAVTAGGSEVSDIRIDLRRGTRDEPRITDAASGLAATSEEYAWQVPARLEPASDYQLQVTVVDDAKRAGCVQATFAIAVGTPPVEPRTATEETPKAAPAEAPTISPAAVVQHTTVPAQAPIRSGSVTSDEASSDSWALLFFTMSMSVLFPAFICAAGGMAYELKEVVFGVPSSEPVGLQYIPFQPSPSPKGPLGLIAYVVEKLYGNSGATIAGLGRGLLHGGVFGAIVGLLMAIVGALAGIIVAVVRRCPRQVVFDEFEDLATQFAAAVSGIAAIAIFFGGYGWQYGGLGVGLAVGIFHAVVVHRELNQRRQERLLGKP